MVVVAVACRTVVADVAADQIVVVASAAAAVDHTEKVVVAYRTVAAAGHIVVAVASAAAARTVHTAAGHRIGWHNFRFGWTRQPSPLVAVLVFS